MKSRTLHHLSSIVVWALTMSLTLAAEPASLPPLVADKLEWNWVGNAHAEFVDDQPSGTGRWVQNFVDEIEVTLDGTVKAEGGSETTHGATGPFDDTIGERAAANEPRRAAAVRQMGARWPGWMWTTRRRWLPIFPPQS